MNTLALDAIGNHAPSAADAAQCFHCGEPNLAGDTFRVTFDGRTRLLCCAGCAAVAQTILDAGLDEFYRQRTGTANKPAQLVPEEIHALSRFNLPGVERDIVQTTGADSKEADLMLDGLTCAACAWLAESMLQRAPGVSAASVNYATGRAHVIWHPTQTSLADLLFAIRRVGLDARPADVHGGAAARARDRRRRLLELLVAGLGMMQVMMYAVPVYLADSGDVAPEFASLMRWASLFLTLPVVLFSARSFFTNAWRDLRVARIGMDVPIALAIASTFLASAWSTYAGSGEVYFDSVSMFVFLLLGARYLEFIARSRAADAIERMAPPLPALVERLTGYPAHATATSVPASELKPGDVIRVPSGSTVPADGIILDGASALDEALLTGEARPVARSIGERVVGGSINTASPLIVKVDQVGEATTLAQISRLARRAAATRPRIAGAVDRIAGRFSLAVLLLAAATVVVWLPDGGDAWFRHAVAVLVVTCPCALALAIPAALTVAMGELSRLGLLVTRGGALETLQQVTDVVFDKTGTLTEAHLKVERIAPLGDTHSDHCLAIAAALEAGSSHPVGQAIATHAALSGMPTLTAVAVSSTSGLGLEGQVDGQRYRLGSAAFVGAIAASPLPAHANTHAPGDTQVYLARNGQWLARFDIAAPVRIFAIDAIASLQARGLNVHLVSGDLPDAVGSVATIANIRNVQAQTNPQGKLDYVTRLQQAGRKVLMVGDGINDAPVLAQADVSIAMADGRSGSDLARSQADIVMLSGDLRRIDQAFELALRTRRVIRQNLGWAIGYNALSVPLAMAGLIEPWIAALGMSASSLLVVANAARLGKARGARVAGRGAREVLHPIVR